MIFDAWIVFFSLEKKTKHKKIFESDICDFYQYKKSDNVHFIIYAYRECLTEKIDWWKYNPENLSST